MMKKILTVFILACLSCVVYAQDNVIDEICMDGGDDIYLQIMPNWDGEDDFYDINQISIEEVSQFKNLKKLTLMSTNIEEIREKLKTLNIDIEQY